MENEKEKLPLANGARNAYQLYPDYTPELKAIREEGITESLICKIIEKHALNAAYNKRLYMRYMALDGAVPIFNRQPRYQMIGEDGQPVPQVNNKVNNDFFGEIVDFKTGYFAGRPISYSYSDTKESEEATGSDEAVDAATKALTDFVTLNNMYDRDMEVTKNAATYGYSGRLFYHDPEGNERVMVIPGYQTIVLSSTSIMEPEYAIRYYETEDLSGATYYVVEFYDDTNIFVYEGQLGGLVLKETLKNLYGYCPLQAIPNNNEMIGDAEKVLAEIDAYDRLVSDSINQIEGQVHSKEIYENVNISEQDIARANYTGALSFHNGMGNGRIYKLESNINDGFVEHQLARLEANILRHSKTPNLNDSAFSGNSSGVALKFKIIGAETKCGMFQAKMQTAGMYMFKLLASSLGKKGITIDPLQCVMGFSRNFPLDTLSNAQAAQALIAAGVPDEVAWDIAIPEIDDIEYVKQVKEEQMANMPSLEDTFAEDFEEDEGGSITPDDKDEDEDDKDTTK